jgi:hypothetical protein
VSRKKHRRSHQPQRRRPPAPRAHDRAEDQPLLQALRLALRSDEPVDLLMTVAGIVEATDPRNRDPFSRQEPGMTLGELVESFLETPYAETTAALSVLRVLLPDPALTARIGEELEHRRYPMPGWLSGLDRVRVEVDAWFLTHVLGDGDDYLFGVVLPSGHAVSALVYVDHNLGSVVKDAFLIGEPLEDVVLKLGTTIEQPEQSLTRTDPASARATVAEAIEHGARIYPPLTSESWPMCRPVVEWLLRLLPDGGAAPERKEWTDREKAKIADAFFASRFGAPLDSEDQRDLLDSLLWFGTDYANGDPFRWSPVTVEMLLDDWFPRKIVDEAAYLAKLPELLRAFIRYAHDRVGINPGLTAETLAAVDHYEPSYQRAIRSARLQGPAALLAGMFDTDPDDLSVGEIMLEGLERAVGGRLQLQSLDDAPLPDEPFEWAGVPDDVQPVVREILELCDGFADAHLDVEHRTAMRRFLGRAAVGDPAIFRRRASTARAAAAIAWVICRANDSAGGYGAGMTVQDLLTYFGVSGSVSQRAEPLLRANGVNPYLRFGSMDLGAPDLLVSQRRSEIIASRDRWTQEPQR